MSDIPPGYCQCGCGGRTKRIIAGCASRGFIAGDWRKYKQGHAGVGSGKHNRLNTKHTAETIERCRASRLEQLAKVEREKRDVVRAEEQRQAKVAEHPAVKLYRETIADRMPKIKARDAKILADVKRTVEAADARAYELRHRGRPKSAKRLPPLAVKRNPDALLAAVPQWQGER